MHRVSPFKLICSGPAGIALARLAIVAAAVLATDASALSLGRSRGTPLIGKPLDISVMGTLESAQESANAQCFEADVFYGDTRLPSGVVRINLDKVSAGSDIAIRVRSTQPVDEPVVTIFLKSTCQQLSTRRYVLLSEASTEELFAHSPSTTPAQRTVPFVSSVTAAPATPPVPSRAVAVAGPAQSNAAVNSNDPLDARAQRRLQRQEARAQRKAIAAEKASLAKRAVKPEQVQATGPSAAGSARPSVFSKKQVIAKPKGAHLELDSADFFAGERSPSLRASSELLSPLATDPQQRLAAAALWKSLQADPSDALLASNRLTALETELAAMRSDGKRQQVAMQGLTADLATARSERYVNGFSMALLFITIAALAAVAYGWVRLKRKAGAGSPWWAGREALDSQPFISAKSVKKGTTPARKSAAEMGFMQDSVKSADGLITPLDASDQWENMDSASSIDSVTPRGLAEAKARLHQDMKDADSLPIASADFSLSIPGMPRTVNAEELFDVQQQAEFFVSLGQHTQAIEILRNHIREYPETSAMAYLDLFEIYHSLKLSHNYETLRADFNRAFNGRIPIFEDYKQVGRGLEYYPRALTRIQLLWPSARVLEVIEESVFRRHTETAEDEGSQSGFDLLAYRELLMLHAIAKDMQTTPTGKALSEGAGAALRTAGPTSEQTLPIRKREASFSGFLNTDLDQLPTFEQSSQAQSPSLIEVMPPSISNVGFNNKGGVLDFEQIDVPAAHLLEELAPPKASKRLGLDINLEAIDSSPVAATLDDAIGLDFDMDAALHLSKKPR
jgi:hypothetical protein